MKMHASLVIPSCVILIAAVNLFAQTASQRSSEQISFSAEEQVKRPVPIPATVMAMLSNDQVVKQVLQSDHLTAEKLPTEWFLASEVHLAGANERDLVVIAKGHLAGANITTFWIFHSTFDRFIPILNAAPAHNLRILDTSSNGHKDIELTSATGCPGFRDLMQVRWQDLSARKKNDNDDSYEVRSRTR
jgi:hypothetical protein